MCSLQCCGPCMCISKSIHWTWCSLESGPHAWVSLLVLAVPILMVGVSVCTFGMLIGEWWLCYSFFFKWFCAGKLVLEALIITAGVVLALTAYTFWASKKGKDFSYLGPILFTSLTVLLLTSFMQVLLLSIRSSLNQRDSVSIILSHIYPELLWYQNILSFFPLVYSLGILCNLCRCSSLLDLH